MAVTFAISTASTTGGTTDASGSFTPAAGDLLIVFVVATGTVGAGTCTESLGETTFTKITSALKASSADTLYLFISNQPLSTAGARTVTFGTGGGGSTGTVITVYRISGQSRFGASASRQTAVQSNQAAAGTPAPAFANACLTGNPTLGVVGNATNAATMTAPTNWTEDSDNGYATPTTGQESISRASGFTGTTVTWGSTSASAFGDIVVEIDSSSFPAGEEDAIEPRMMKHKPFEPEISVWQ